MDSGLIIKPQLQQEGFSLELVREEDLETFIWVERVSHYKYVAEHQDYFGEWNESILINAFHAKLGMTYFRKIVLQGEIVGFLGYDQKTDRIDNVFIRIVDKAQHKGIGSGFLTSLQHIALEQGITVFLAVIKTNPAQNLYKKLGFECCKEQDVFRFFTYPAPCSA